MYNKNVTILDENVKHNIVIEDSYAGNFHYFSSFNEKVNKDLSTYEEVTVLEIEEETSTAFTYLDNGGTPEKIRVDNNGVLTEVSLLTKGTIDAKLALKADTSTVNTALALKANKNDVYNKEYIDALKDKNGWESELLETLENNGTIALSIINQFDEIQMYAKDTSGVIDNENIRPSLMQSGDKVYFFDDTQAFITVNTVFSFTAPVGYTLQVVGLKYTDLTAEEVAFDDTTLALGATNVQEAITKVVTERTPSQIDLKIKDVGLDTPIEELNNHTLREVFEGGNLITDTWVETLSVDTLTVNENNVVVIESSGNRGRIDNIFTSQQGLFYERYELKLNSISNGYISTRLAFENSDYNIKTYNQIRNHSVSNLVQMDTDIDRFYIVDNESSTWSIEISNIFIINLDLLGISTLTVSQMEYWFSVYQSIKDKGVLAYIETKEKLENKAIDFNVVDDTKYPSVQAVRNYVRDIGLDTPIVELNNHSLREVFKDTSLFYSKQLIQNPVFQLGTTGWDTSTETTFTVNDRIATIQTNDNNILRGIVQGLPNTSGKKIYYAIKYTSDNDVWFGDSSVQLTTGLATASYSHISDVMTPSSDVGFRISNKNATPTLINVDYAYSFNISSLQTDRQYSPLYQDTFDNLSENQAKLQIDEFVSKQYLFIDYGTLGINTITTAQMDYWHTIYQSILLYGSLGHLYNYIKIVENEASSKYVEHDFSNKKIVCFGDSITQGSDEFDRYTTYMAQRLKATIYNVGFGGTRMSFYGATTYDRFCMYQLADAVVSGNFALQDAQIGELPEFATNLNLLKTINFEDVDYVTIFLGANDYASGVAIDNVLDEDDTETYAGATRYVLNKLLTAFPHLKIILITPTWRSRIASGDGKDADNYPNENGDYLYEFVDASIGVAKEFKQPVLDMFYGNFVNLYTHTIYLSDGLHPNDKGAKLLSNRISQFLLNY